MTPDSATKGKSKTSELDELWEKLDRGEISQEFYILARREIENR